MSEPFKDERLDRYKVNTKLIEIKGWVIKVKYHTAMK